MNLCEIFYGVGLGIRNDRLDLGNDLDLDPGISFSLLNIAKYGITSRWMIIHKVAALICSTK